MTRTILPLSLCCLLLAVLPAAPAPVPADAVPRLLVAAVAAGKGAKIVTVNTSNGTVKDLTDGKANDGDPAWSPGGRRIAFVSARDGPPNVYVMDADGKNVVQCSTAENANGNVFPAWSPDGKRIAFGDLVEGVLQVRVCDGDGKNAQTLTSGNTSCFPAWSPDGKKIAFTRFEA